MASKEFLSQSDLAETLGISRSSAQNMLLAGRLPYVEIGNRRYTRREWVLDWLSKPDNEPKPDPVDVELDDLRDRRAQAVRNGVTKVCDLPASTLLTDDVPQPF